MSEVIKDGYSGNTARVDSKNRLHSFATTETGGTEAGIDGDLYNVNTETIVLSTSNPSALVYMKNTDTVPWIYNRVFYNAGPSTGGAGDFLAEVIRNPTTGTLIDSGTAFDPINLNFGSSKELIATTLKGAEGSTITNGIVAVSTIIPTAGTRVLISFDSIVLQPGSSIAIRITPQSGNTSMGIQVGFNLYRVIA